ncbi:MAG: hypothetical protein ACHP78_03905 [Terriglobales bacterium]
MKHLPADLALAAGAAEVADATTLLQKVQLHLERCERVLARVERTPQWSTIFQGHREVRSYLELLGRITGELQQQAAVNFNFMNVRDEDLLAWCHAVKAHGAEAVERTKALIFKELGVPAPVLNVRFVKAPPAPELPALLEGDSGTPPANGNGHA